jgi:hypothetical protein
MFSQYASIDFIKEHIVTISTVVFVFVVFITGYLFGRRTKFRQTEVDMVQVQAEPQQVQVEHAEQTQKPIQFSNTNLDMARYLVKSYSTNEYKRDLQRALESIIDHIEQLTQAIDPTYSQQKTNKQCEFVNISPRLSTVPCD